MLMVVSPAKKLDEAAQPQVGRSRQPRLLKQTEELAGIMRTYSAASLGKLLGISPALAKLNAARYNDFATPFSATNAKQALFMFAGDTYTGVDAATLSAAEVRIADKRLCILSGLYGVLSPLDWMQPYRLEMGTRLPTPRGKGLYEFWGASIALALNKQAKKESTPYVLNLASQEYAKAALHDELQLKVIDCVFKEQRGSTEKVISFSAKRARGMMARYVIQNDITRPDDLRAFNASGYKFSARQSSAESYIFVRPEQ